jgi:hypothetical protein
MNSFTLPFISWKSGLCNGFGHPAQEWKALICERTQLLLKNQNLVDNFYIRPHFFATRLDFNDRIF